MDQVEATIIWTAFEDVAPNLCYIHRTREFLEDLLEETEDTGHLLELLEVELARIENPSFRTDMRILGERIKRYRKQAPLEG